MKRRFQKIACASAFVGLLFSSPSHAQGIRVLDCNGQTRAVHQSQATIDYNVEAKIVDKTGAPRANSEVTLTSKHGRMKAITSDNGIAEFPGVKSGVWLIGTPELGLFYSAISLSDVRPPAFWDNVGSSVVDVLEVTAIAGVAVGAGILISDAADGGGGGGNDGGGDNGNGGMPGDECTSCAPDAEAPSVPGFRGR